MVGKNTILKFRMQDGKLVPCENYTELLRQSKIDAELSGKIIIDSLDEQEYQTGSLVRVVCGHCD